MAIIILLIPGKYKKKEEKTLFRATFKCDIRLYYEITN
jgi:hypothetical protein